MIIKQQLNFSIFELFQSIPKLILFDSGSKANLISEDLVKKLNLETIPHPRTYPLGWICKNENLQVTRKHILRFAIRTNFLDEVELVLVPLDISEFFLGSPYLYDRKYIFHHHETSITCSKMA